MTKRTKTPRAYCAAVPLSALPELQEFLEPFMGGGESRGNVVMMRLGDESVQRLDELVEGGLFRSRSEAAAFLVGTGIQAQKNLFQKIARHGKEIKRVRQELRRTALEALKEVVGSVGERKPRGKPRKTKSGKRKRILKNKG